MTTELPIAVIALKINAQTSISNFRRNPYFFASFSFFYNKLLTDLYKHPACIEIKQQDNTITILWNLDKANIESILAKHKTIHKILREPTNALPTAIYIILSFWKLVFVILFNYSIIIKHLPLLCKVI